MEAIRWRNLAVREGMKSTAYGSRGIRRREPRMRNTLELSWEVAPKHILTMCLRRWEALALVTNVWRSGRYEAKWE